MAIAPVPQGGNPEKTRLDMETEHGPVVDELTESPEGDERLERGSTSALIAGDLTLQERPHGPDTATIIERLPEGTKKMLGIG